MNIFVANLNFAMDSDSLRELFEQYGDVSSARIITDRDSGRSKGFGFVEMDEEAEALEAIKQLDEIEIEGRNIVVKKANPRESGGNRGGRRY